MTSVNDGHISIVVPDARGTALVIPVQDTPEKTREAIVRAMQLASFTREKYLGTFPDLEPAPTAPDREERKAPPKCSKHRSAMKEGRKGWYCPRKDDSTDSGYCEETA